MHATLEPWRVNARGQGGHSEGLQQAATPILDRLLQHATTLNIKGESFRLKEKRKAGLLTEPVNPPKPEGDK